MIKIKKISLQNFKGIKSKTIFSFDTQGTSVNVMSGPNGFGKTTIFDVMELCITGEFKRVALFKEVQKKTNNKNKPFFQNTDGENVTLKLWIEDTTTGSNHLIIKHYDDETSPTRVKWGRDFIPDDANNIFATYLTTDSAFFDSNDFSSLASVEQESINELFYGTDSNVDLSSTYYLFNYIQQEDSIYFLRKNEDDKGASLGFLFNIEKEEQEKQKIQELKDSLVNQSNSITGQMNVLREALPNSQNAQYQKLFSESDFEFDRESPFTQIENAREKLTAFETTINSLIEFRNNFSVSEFEKSIKYKKLNDEIIGNNQLLSAILIRKIYTDDLVTKLDETNSKITRASEFLKKADTSFIEQQYFDDFLNSQEELTAYKFIEQGIKTIDQDLGEIGKIISDLNSQRQQILNDFVKIKDTLHVSDSNCPLCDTGFDSFDSLNSAIVAKSSSLTAFNNTKIEQKVLLQGQLKEVNSKIATSAKQFISENKVTEKEIISLLRNYPNMKDKVDEIFNTYTVLSSAEIEPINLSTVPTLLAEINEKQVALKVYLEEKLLPEFRFNELQIGNKQFYQEFFNSKADLFEATSSDLLNSKLEYLRGTYAAIANTRLQFLESRQEKLGKVIGYVNNIYEKVHRTIQDHKAEMIQNIKIPFYIYSGKILQSYQQGLGIFVEIHTTGQSNNVRFKTGHSSDHDIVYHLSSGQMAVVSLAFCLSLNKVYNTNQNFRFLAIDDPIQTMDDLNIHTFIELVRNEFSDYQLIMSTHDDFTSRYMKYKFDKFSMNTDIQNVQEIVLAQLLN